MNDYAKSTPKPPNLKLTSPARKGNIHRNQVLLNLKTGNLNESGRSPTLFNMSQDIMKSIAD